MDRSSKNTVRDTLAAVCYGIFFLFFFQLISDFIESIYAFGLLKTSLTAEVGTVLLLLSPLLLLAWRKGLPRWLLLLLGELVLLSRVTETFLGTRGRMFVAGAGTACFLLFLPALFWELRKEGRNAVGRTLGSGLTIGLLASIMLRALGSGLDLSAIGMFQALAWALALLAGLLLVVLRRGTPPESEPPAEAREMGRKRKGTGRFLALGVGAMASLTMLYFVFCAPSVIARWTGVSYIALLSVLVTTLCVFGIIFVVARRFWDRLPLGVIMGWNALFVAALVLTILLNQPLFPMGPEAYPFFAPLQGPLPRLAVFVMLLLAPIVVLDFVLCLDGLASLGSSFRALGGAFGVGSFMLLLMIFAHIFTTVYDYIPLVGPFFRDKFWLVHLVLALLMGLPVLCIGKRADEEAAGKTGEGTSLSLAALLAGLGVLAIVGAYINAPRPRAPTPAATVRILTYNIQQGYSEDGLKNFDGQLAILRANDADIIALQESDTARISGGNSDIVRYFADHLDLYSYYGPKTVAGTFGIALLSKYPIEDPRTFYMYSEGEQTATIVARIVIGGRTFTVFVTHLGNGGPIVQQEAILKEVADGQNVVLMGDFNFRPATAQFDLTIQVLQDAWLLRWGEGPDAQGMLHDERIDHVFLSPGLVVDAARYVESAASDHPALVVEVEN
jgi:endonuclease/exonuclease/phosphatase family metal-dependent hydrolase